MKVTNDVTAISGMAESRSVGAAGERDVASSQRSSEGLPSASTLELSGQVADVEEIAQAARQADAIRVDVVEQAKADMAAGTLTADSNELAALIARDLF